jgi:hypothetical protein
MGGRRWWAGGRAEILDEKRLDRRSGVMIYFRLVIVNGGIIYPMINLRDRMLFIYPNTYSVEGMNCITPSAEVSLR